MEMSTQICAVCSIESKLKCSNCANVFYCSVAHQKDNWKTHKKECYPIQVTDFHYLYHNIIKKSQCIIDRMRFYI